MFKFNGNESNGERGQHLNGSRIKCQTKLSEMIWPNKAGLAELNLQTFVFDWPSCTKELNTDGEKLRLTISNCLQIQLADWLSPAVGSMCFTPLELSTAANCPTHNVVAIYCGLLQPCTVGRKPKQFQYRSSAHAGFENSDGNDKMSLQHLWETLERRFGWQPSRSLQLSH